MKKLLIGLLLATGLVGLGITLAPAEFLGNVTLGRDGANSAPAITFSSEGTLGFYRPRSGVVALVGGKLAVKEITVAITPGSQSANTCATQDFTVTGVALTDRVILVDNPTTGNATGYGTARVSAADTVKQIVCNPTAGALTPGAGNFTYLVFGAQ